LSGRRSESLRRHGWLPFFLDLENQLFQAVQSEDRAGLDSILADDFQLWTPNPPGGPVPREDWKNQSLAENLKEFHIRQMAARSVEENVTVELRAHQSCKGRWEAPARDYFVADLWQKSEDKWKLSDRYASPLSVVSSRQVRGKPTGKD